MNDRYMLALMAVAATALVMFMISRSKKKTPLTAARRTGRPRASLGSGRTILPGNQPKAHSKMKSKFMKEDYKVLGNPFAVKMSDGFDKDTERKLGSAFPFSSDSRGGKFTPRKSSSFKSSVQKVSDPPGKTRGDKFNAPKSRSLGAAVSPSSLVSKKDKVSNFSKKLSDVNKVASNTGGNLNLLHPL
jgi:hypothetical protein